MSNNQTELQEEKAKLQAELSETNAPSQDSDQESKNQTADDGASVNPTTDPTPTTPESSNEAVTEAETKSVDMENSAAQNQSEAPAAETVAATSESEAASSEEEAGKPKIKIGSQRSDGVDSPGPKAVVPKAVKDAQETPVPMANPDDRPSEPAPVGPSVGDLGDQWEKEAAASLDNSSVGEMMELATASADVDLEVNARIKGTVTKVHGDGVFFLLKGQYDGVLPLKQFKKEPEPGTMTDVVIAGFNSEESLYELTLPGAAVAVADWSDVTVGKKVEVRITGSNTGGLECSINNIRGFIPASQIDVSRVENLGGFVNQTLECVITEANKKKRNLVLSRRAILEEDLKERKKELLEQFEVGSTVEGKITKLRDFGAFVNIGSGIEGLIHISKCSWHHIKHPSEVFTEGQDVSVRIEKINKETGKIQLSHRDTIEHPWKRVAEKYPVDTSINGTVSKIADFGAFVKLETGVEGLVHISEIAHERVKSVGSVLSEGQDVEAKVLSIDPDKQKISLSLKALLPVPERAEQAAGKNADPKVPPRESAVKKRDKPLRGGTGNDTGGDQFGLKW